MITTLIRSGLRLAIVVALFALAVSGYQAPVLAPAVSSPQASRPVQSYIVADGVVMGEIHFDEYEVVVPKPTPVVKQQAAAPRKPSIPAASPAVAQSYARGKVTAGQWQCLLLLWNRESGWNVHADNPGSTAYGIPQALPGSKMASAGADWHDNYRTQVNWGLSYIKAVYGTPCGAWAHSQARGWY